ncbi:uncharacterized protein EV154DRAFT_532614, partial [Mucor mucedo]|uniref:uncharacterized protein n=1 Tax=Mucor mucedo TaxID=29922 RepID=UPI0022201E83
MFSTIYSFLCFRLAVVLSATFLKMLAKFVFPITCNVSKSFSNKPIIDSNAWCIDVVFFFSGSSFVKLLFLICGFRGCVWTASAITIMILDPKTASFVSLQLLLTNVYIVYGCKLLDAVKSLKHLARQNVL